MVTSLDISAYLLMWTMCIWVSGHTMVSMRVHIGLAYIALMGRGQSIMTQVTRSINMTLATLKNPALMLAAVMRGLGHIPAKGEYAYHAKCYHMIKEIESQKLSFEDSLLYLENCESVCAMLWYLPSSLPSKKDDNQKTQHIATLAGLIRAEYAESGRLPIWVDSILAGVKLEEIQTTRTSKGKRTNKTATTPAIGASVETYTDSENESDGASPLIPKRTYAIGGLVVVAKSVSNASGLQGTQIIECSDDILARRLKRAKTFEIDGISGYTWRVVASDADSGVVYATWHKQSPVYTKAKATTTAQQAASVPAAKAKAKAKATESAPTKAQVLARVMAMLDTLED